MSGQLINIVMILQVKSGRMGIQTQIFLIPQHLLLT